MGSSDMAAQDEFGSTGSNGVVSASNGISLSAGGVQLKDDQFSSGNGFTPKVRKPYTITKQRERWTEEEHKKFLEALKLFGRAWRKIEEHVGSKTAVQIRSHAQKFFSKVASDPNGGNAASEEAIDIPPPRPKKKPMHPYPRKLVHPLNKETCVAEQSARSASPNLSVLEQENQSPKSVLSVIGSDALGSTDSDTPGDGLSSDSNAAGVNSGKLIDSEPNQLLEESGSTINNCLLPNKQLKMKLELFSTDDFDASGGSAEEASTRSLKLFGRTVLVTDSHRPSSRAAGTSKSLPPAVQEEKPVQTSLPCNLMDVESASVKVEHVWDNFPYAGHQGTYFMQFQNQNSNAVESGTNAYTVPWWTLCPPFIPFHKQQQQQQQPANEHVDSKKDERERSCTGSDAGSASDDENRDKEVETQGDQHVSDKDREPNSVLQFKISANSAFSELRTSTGKYRKGFVPYKRCMAERDAKSSTMASEVGDGKRVRLSCVVSPCRN